MTENHGERSPWREDDHLDVLEGILGEIHTRSLEPVMKVSLRLMALASFADTNDRQLLLAQVDQLDAAVRNARGMFFPQRVPTLTAAPSEPAEGRVEVALLDRNGLIVWTNDAWAEFCRANDGDPRRAGAGTSYLGVCDAAGDPPSADLARAIRTAVEGGLPVPARTVVSCPAPGQPRAFETLVSTRFDDSGQALGALITLEQVGVTPFGEDHPVDATEQDRRGLHQRGH